MIHQHIASRWTIYLSNIDAPCGLTNVNGIIPFVDALNSISRAMFHGHAFVQIKTKKIRLKSPRRNLHRVAYLNEIGRQQLLLILLIDKTNERDSHWYMNSLTKRIYIHFRLTGTNINLCAGGRNLTVIRESWLVVKNVPGFIGADMIAVIENNVPFRRRIHTNTHSDVRPGIRTIDLRKRFSIFSIMRLEILRFPHHPRLSSRRVFTARQNKQNGGSCVRYIYRIPLSKRASSGEKSTTNRSRVIH